MSEPHPDHPLSPERRRLGRLALGGAAALATLPALAQTAERAGLVDNLVGEAVAELKKDRRLLASGGNVFVGDSVSTAEESRVALLVGEATTIRLGPRARLKIDRFIMNAGGTLTLQSGAMTFNRPPSETPQPMAIRGAFGMIAVRGTYFFAGPSRGASGVLVLRGSVSVASGGETVILQAGEGTDVARPGARPSPPAIWSQARIDEALASVR